MFAKIYNSARNILSRSPSATTVPTESNEEKPRSQNSIADMVTTRAAASAQNTPSATPSAAGRKTKRGLGEDDTPAAAAKRRRNTKSGKKSQDDVVKEDAEEGPVTTASADDSTPNDPVVATVEIQPSSEPSEAMLKSPEIKLPTRRRASPTVVVPKADSPERITVSPAKNIQDMEFHTPGAHRASSVSIYATPATTLRKRESPTPTAVTENDAAEPTPTNSTDGKRKRGGKKRGNQKKVTKTTVVVEVPVEELENTEADNTPAVKSLPEEIPSSTMETEEASQSAEESNNEPTPVPARKQKGNNAKGKKADKKLAPETAPPTFDSKKPESTQVSSKKAPGKAGKKHIRFDDNEEPEEQPAEKPVPVIINKAGHTRFGAAEPAQPAEEPAPSHTVGESEASDSDDEAPETVTAASALSTAKAAQVEAARAREAAEAKEKQKKKERADRIAEEQRLKKKKEAKKLEKQQAREAQQAKPEADAEDADAMDLDIHNLPALLPTSLLEAAPERRPPTPPLTFFTGPSAADLKQEKLNRHIKFLEHGEKPVKDVRKGPVNVHVLGSQNKFLAPKVNRDTRNVREQWLKGRQVQKVDRKGRKKLTGARVERRAVTGGFLRGDD